MQLRDTSYNDEEGCENICRIHVRMPSGYVTIDIEIPEEMCDDEEMKSAFADGAAAGIGEMLSYIEGK